MDDHPGPGSKTLDGKALKGYNFTTFFVTSVLFCLESCAANCKCSSMNYNTSQSNGSLACELNYETKDNKPEALVDEMGSYYYDVDTYPLQVSAAF